MLLKAKMGEAGERVPTDVMPDWVIWLASYLKPDLRQIVPILGKKLAASNDKARCGTPLSHCHNLPRPFVQECCSADKF